jgi:hypothetical protein
VSGPVQNPANQVIWGADTNVPAQPVAPATKGYDAHIATRNGRSYDRANGQISNATFKWPLFITDISIDLSVQGNIAQSQLTRDFYPHNFVQPGFTVTGISLDNVDYGQMCDFIHMCQIGMIQQFSESNLIQLQVAHRGIPALDTTIINGVKVVENQGTYTATGASNAVTRTVNGVEQITGQSWEPTSGRMVQSISANGKTVKTGYNQSIRGPHKEIIAMGVIGSIQRIHQTAVPNPTWTFQFQVFRMIKGPYREGPTKAGSGNFKTWVDLLDSGLAEPGSISSTAAMKKQNTALLKKTLKDSANIFNTTSGHGSYTPGGQSSGGGGSSGGSTGGSTGPAAGTMYDSADPGAAGLPTSNVTAVAGYIDDGGEGQQLFAQYPNAHHLGISREADSNVGTCLDVESGCPGSYPPDRCGAWAKRRIAAGIVPVIYSNQTDYPGCVASLKAAGVTRSQYKFWLAKLTSDPPSFPISGFDVDAVQYIQNQNGVDISVYAEGFFT